MKIENNRYIKTIYLILLQFVGLLVVSACSDNPNIVANTKCKVLKVAVFMNGDEKPRWESTAQWALDNISKAQQGLNNKIELKLVFFEQDKDNSEDYMQQIAQDSSFVAIIGPTSSKCAIKMAEKLSVKKEYHKPMISPSATKVHYQRMFANTSYVWNMAESDIAQLEVIISGIASNLGFNSAMLLAADDGDDYAEWFGFIAEEYGVSVDGIYLYEDSDDIRKYVRKLCGSDQRLGFSNLIFNPKDTEIALAFDDEIRKMRKEFSEQKSQKYLYVPTIYCSDAFVNDRIASTAKNADYQGVDLCAMPESGFMPAYKQYFARDLVNGESQFYDAICLIAYAATLSNYSGQTLNDAIMSVVDGKDGVGGSWLPMDMRSNFICLSNGVTPDINGVSSTWTFDSKTHASVVGSTYRRWNLYDGKYVTIEYMSTDGGYRSSSSKNLWDWTSSHLQSFEHSEGNNNVYPQLLDKWALLIAASTGWGNYRFQADVFAMYQILKKHGYDDKHIILICEDDLAYNEKNVEPGVIRVKDDGENLYDSSAIDYKLSDLTAEDIRCILQGKQSDRLPNVIRATENDDVFIFWSSHGDTNNTLDFGGMRSIDYEQIKEILLGTTHRKMLFTIEACFSGGLGQYCEGIPGLLFITAANPYEQSQAAVWSNQLGVYRSNSFTCGFQEAITTNAAISLRDLYYHLANSTSGSHVKVYNVSNYGSVYDNTMSDYFQ